MSIIGQYENLSDVLLQGDLVVKVPQRMQWLRLFSIVGIQGAQYTVAQAVNQSNADDPLENAAFVTSGGTGVPNNSLTTIPQSQFDLGLLATAFELTYGIEDIVDTPGEPTAIEERLARVRIFQQVSQHIGKTSSVSEEPKTLRELCSNNNVVDVDASTQLDLVLGMIDDALGRITANEGICTFIMMTTAALNTLRQAHYSVGIKVDTVPVYFPGIGSVNVPAYAGVPILINDEIPDYTTGEAHTSTRIFFCATRTNAINPDECLTMFSKQKFMPDLIRTRRTNSTTIGDADCHIDVTMPIGTALPSDGALSILEGFKIFSPTW